MGSNFNYQSTISEFNWEMVNNEIECFCMSHALPASKLFTAQLVIEELVTNIIKYGKRNGRETITIDAAVQGDQIELIISDTTHPFNPLDTTEPDTGLPAEERAIGGLGLVLVRQKSKSISYQYINGANRIEIVI